MKTYSQIVLNLLVKHLPLSPADADELMFRYIRTTAPNGIRWHEPITPEQQQELHTEIEKRLSAGNKTFTFLIKSAVEVAKSKEYIYQISDSTKSVNILFPSEFSARDVIDRIHRLTTLNQHQIAENIFGKSRQALNGQLRRNNLDIEPIYKWAVTNKVDLHWLLTGHQPHTDAKADFMASPEMLLLRLQAAEKLVALYQQQNAQQQQLIDEYLSALETLAKNGRETKGYDSLGETKKR